MRAANASHAVPEPDARTNHAHHWLIAAQQGPHSPAFCRLCGANREFANSFDGNWARPVGRPRRVGASPPKKDVQ